MKNNLDSKAVKDFYRAVLSLKDEAECAAFFSDLFTVNELLSISQRLEVGYKLLNKETYQKISNETGASTATISRVNRLLSNEKNSIEMVKGRSGILGKFGGDKG